jgi:hypothetical protein
MILLLAYSASPFSIENSEKQKKKKENLEKGGKKT